jgi:hypothetical protein
MTNDGAARASALGAETVVHDGVTGGGVPEPEDDEDWECPPQAARAASAATGVARSAAARLINVVRRKPPFRS